MPTQALHPAALPLEERKSRGVSFSGDAPTWTVTSTDLAMADGNWAGPRIYVALNGKVYDVSSRADLYGPRGPYHHLAGKDVTRALATMSLSKAEADRTDLSGIGTMELRTLGEWTEFFAQRYECVGSYPAGRRVIEEVLQPRSVTTVYRAPGSRVLVSEPDAELPSSAVEMEIRGEGDVVVEHGRAGWPRVLKAGRSRLQGVLRDLSRPEDERKKAEESDDDVSTATPGSVQ